MTLKKFSRAGLCALACGILLGLVLSVPTFHSSYAQAPGARRSRSCGGAGGRSAAAGLRRQSP